MNNGHASSVEKTLGDVATVDDYLARHFNGPRTDANAQQWDRKKEEMGREERVRLDRMSPKGALHLPPLLDARRLEWLITDGAFAMAPLYNRVYVHQIPSSYSVGKKKGLIHTPDTVAARELRACHRGVLVSAGALALDALRSNGVDLGHIVHYIHVNPWRLFVDYAEGIELQVLVMSVDCIAGSEDLADVLRSGAAKMTIENGKHQILDAEGQLWNPEMPQGVEVW